MPTYYVDPINGNDADDGLSWANAFLTLNGAEDEPVAAGDLVWVGPGVYRELLTLDVNGAGGNPITYAGDPTGEHTDGVGGIVRVTGSDNDQTAARAHCIDTDSRDHRTFRGFSFDTVSSRILDFGNGCTNIIIEDCVLHRSAGTQPIIWFEDTGQSDNIVTRCVFLGGGRGGGIYFSHSGTVDNTSQLVQNCVFIGCQGTAIRIARIGGIAVRNCLLYMCISGIRVEQALTIGQTCTVNNCILVYCTTALQATAVAEMPEDFNTLYGNVVDRNIVNVGGNSQTYPALLLPPILLSGASQISGFKFPWWFGELSEWSQVRAITGTNEPTEDLFGVARPATASKNSWGPQQFADVEIEIGTVQAGTYSRVLHDAGSVLVRRVPVTGVEITVTLYMRFEADYEPDPASLPRMVIKQPGQADRSTVMTVAANNWEQLSDTFTPASPPGFIEVWAESRNTTVPVANYEVFYDTMDVS